MEPFEMRRKLRVDYVTKDVLRKGMEGRITQGTVHETSWKMKGTVWTVTHSNITETFRQKRRPDLQCGPALGTESE